MTIPAYLLDAINAQADLVGIVSKHTKLKPSNGKFVGCCPFHNEKTPSFSIDPQKNLYHCFGCGVGGNAFNFLMSHDNMTFMEAVKELAQSTGIELPKQETKQYTYQRKTAPKQSPNPNHAQGQNRQKQNSTPTPAQHAPAQRTIASNTPNVPTPDGTLHGLLQAVAHFYRERLGQHTDALRYFAHRGLSADTIHYFGLGYAPSDWHHLQNAFPNDLEGLIALGLVRQSDKGGYYSFFRDRAMFAIKDGSGQVVGFAGRAMNDEIKPKYLNSTDSPIFKKSHILYGAYEAKQKRVRDFLVVEGYMDVIALHQAGIYGAVAPMGTAMNEAQIARLLRTSNVLTLCFDGDEAGQKAALRTLQTAMPVLEDGKELRFLTLPDKHDPDTYINAFGSKKMREALEMATPLSSYLANYLQYAFDPQTPEQVAAAMRYVRELTDQLPKKSSFRWSLNKTLYQSLTTKKKQPLRQQAPARPINTGETFMLTILYQPALVLGDWLGDFYKKSALPAVDEQFFGKLDNIPPLPDSHALNVKGLDALLSMATAVATMLPQNPRSRIDIDSHAQSILAAMDDGTTCETESAKAHLTRLWRGFFNVTCNNSLGDVTLMFDELLCRLVGQALEREQALPDKQTLLLSTLYKRRLACLKVFADGLFAESNLNTNRSLANTNPPS